MPIHLEKDNSGWFYQWGNSGKKYRFRLGNSKSKAEAKSKAGRQARAIYASGYKNK